MWFNQIGIQARHEISTLLISNVRGVHWSVSHCKNLDLTFTYNDAISARVTHSYLPLTWLGLYRQTDRRTDRLRHGFKIVEKIVSFGTIFIRTFMKLWDLISLGRVIQIHPLRDRKFVGYFTHFPSPHNHYRRLVSVRVVLWYSGQV